MRLLVIGTLLCILFSSAYADFVVKCINGKPDSSLCDHFPDEPPCKKCGPTGTFTVPKPGAPAVVETRSNAVIKWGSLAVVVFACILYTVYLRRYGYQEAEIEDTPSNASESENAREADARDDAIAVASSEIETIPNSEADTLANSHRLNESQTSPQANIIPAESATVPEDSPAEILPTESQNTNPSTTASSGLLHDSPASPERRVNEGPEADLIVVANSTTPAPAPTPTPVADLTPVSSPPSPPPAAPAQAAIEPVVAPTVSVTAPVTLAIVTNVEDEITLATPPTTMPSRGTQPTHRGWFRWMLAELSDGQMFALLGMGCGYISATHTDLRQMLLDLSATFLAYVSTEFGGGTTMWVLSYISAYVPVDGMIHKLEVVYGLVVTILILLTLILIRHTFGMIAVKFAGCLFALIMLTTVANIILTFRVLVYLFLAACVHSSLLISKIGPHTKTLHEFSPLLMVPLGAFLGYELARRETFSLAVGSWDFIGTLDQYATYLAMHYQVQTFCFVLGAAGVVSLYLKRWKRQEATEDGTTVTPSATNSAPLPAQRLRQAAIASGERQHALPAPNR